jgi:hypothetical protein
MLKGEGLPSEYVYVPVLNSNSNSVNITGLLNNRVLDIKQLLNNHLLKFSYFNQLIKENYIELFTNIC